MNMHWARMLLLFLIPLITSKTLAQEVDVTETTTFENNNVSNDEPSSDDQVQLDSNLRSALLKALSELEGDETSKTQAVEDDEKDIERAQASAVTYFTNDEEERKTSEDEQSKTDTIENHITTTVQETSGTLPSNVDSQENSSEDPENNSTENASEVLVQKSDGIQSAPITAIEREPVDFFRDAEQIITSASNSFITQNGGESVSSHTPRSVKSTDSDTKIASFSNLNTIRDLETKTPAKEVDESPFVRTYVRPLGNFVNNDVALVQPAETYVKSANVDVSAKSTVTSEAKSVKNGDAIVKSNGNGVNIEAATETTLEVSTEENEAKVEQVQFFSAPLVAAFTVHQDERGQPKRVEPIFKNEINPKKGATSTQRNIPQENENLQSQTFNNLDLQKKQQILEQELEKLRNQQLLQQQNFLGRNNNGINAGFNNQVGNNQGFTQEGFSQAIKQNFNQFDPIFTEPDRSVVTKLAAIDPNTLLSQNGGPLINKFMPSEAILPLANPVKPSFTNNIVPDSKPGQQNYKNKGEVSFIPSISFDPIIEAGKLPLNAQILPNREPTGFLNFVPNANVVQNNPSIQQQVRSNLVQSSLNQVQPNSNFIQSNSNLNNNNFAQSQQNLIRPSQSQAQPNQNSQQPNSNLIQPSVTLQNANFLGHQTISSLKPVQTQPNTFLGFNNDIRGQNVNQNNQFLTSNRILRQEQGSANLGLNQNGFSIVRSQQPFNPTHELSYFPDNRFVRNNQASLAQPSFGGQSQPSSSLAFQGAQNNFFNGNNQNQNRFFRSNLEGTLTSPNSFSIQQSVQPFGQQAFNNNPQSNRFFRSNQEGTLTSPNAFGNNQNLGFGQVQSEQNNRFLRSNLESTFLGNQNRFLGQPALQNYKYSNAFGFSRIPLNKK